VAPSPCADLEAITGAVAAKPDLISAPNPRIRTAGRWNPRARPTDDARRPTAAGMRWIARSRCRSGSWPHTAFERNQRSDSAGRLFDK